MGMLSVLIVLAVFIGTCLAQSCTKIDECSCRLDDGRVVSLQALNGNPSLISGVLGSDNNKYHFNPCQSRLEFGAECTAGLDAAACQEDGNGDYYSLGRTSTVEYSVINTGDPVQTEFAYLLGTPADFFARTLRLTVLCDLSATANLIFDREETDYEKSYLVYFLTLRSKWGCPDYREPSSSSIDVGLSGGSIVVIIFFVLLVTYAIVGVAYQVGRHQKRGVEMIPNLEFWKAIPGYITGGAGFLFGLCGGGGGGSKEGYENL